MRVEQADWLQERFQQTNYQWLYIWTRHRGEVYVTDQVSGDKFLWIPI